MKRRSADKGASIKYYKKCIMAKYYKNKEELHKHYFDIFKDIIDAIANSKYEEDLNELTFSFDGITYIPFGKVIGYTVKNFENTETHRLLTEGDKRFRTEDEDLEKYHGNLKLFTVGLNQYAYIECQTLYENTKKLEKRNIPINEFAIINTSDFSWNFVEDCLVGCEKDNDFKFTDSYFYDDLMFSSRRFTLKSKTIINNVLANYGCTADDNYNGMMIVNSIYYDLENTTLDFPTSADKEFEDVHDYINDNFHPLKDDTAYTQIYFTFFKDNREKALYCNHLIDNDDSIYKDELDKVWTMLNEMGADFICINEIQYERFTGSE